MTDIKPGDVVTYSYYGKPFRAKVTEIKPSGVVYAVRLDGPLAGWTMWTFAEGLTKEPAE